MQDEFQGGVFSGALEGGRAGASVWLEADAVAARVGDGPTFRVRYAECKLELGGASGRMWFCRTPDRGLTIFCEAPDFGQALRATAHGELGDALARIEAAGRRAHRHAALLWGAALFALGAVLFGAYLGVRHAGRASVAILPRAVDEQLGELALDNMRLEGQVSENPVLNEALRNMLKRLAPKPVDGFTFQLRVVDAPIVNAFALPGGPIVVYTGLIRAADRPEQVAGVLAHEMAHVTLRHGMQRIAQSLGVIAGIQLLFGDVSGVAAVAVEVLREGTINSYSREQEHEADMQGVKTLVAAELDPGALADFFGLLQKREAGSLSVPAWLGTHPDLGQRIRDVRAAAARSAPAQVKPIALDWAEVQRHAGAP